MSSAFKQILKFQKKSIHSREKREILPFYLKNNRENKYLFKNEEFVKTNSQ